MPKIRWKRGLFIIFNWAKWLLSTIITILLTAWILGEWEKVENNPLVVKLTELLEVFNMAIADLFAVKLPTFALIAFFCIPIYGLLQLFWDNVLVYRFRPKYISREKKLLDRNNVLEEGIERAKTSYQTSRDKWIDREATLLANLTLSDKEVGKLHKQNQNFAPTTEPTELQLECFNGNWLGISKRNIGEIKIIASPVNTSDEILGYNKIEVMPIDWYNPDIPESIEAKTIRHRGRKPKERYDPEENVTYMMLIFFDKSLTKRRNEHICWSLTEDGNEGKKRLFNDFAVYNELDRNIVRAAFTVTAKGSYVIKCKFQ